MDPTVVALFSTQATQVKLQHCELDNQFGCESKARVAVGEIFKRVVAVIDESSDQSSDTE
jgi:hypothetical protein